MQTLIQIGCVALGSSLGGLLRWGIGTGLLHLLGSAFPWGTLFINVTGSFVLGWFSTLLTERMAYSEWINVEYLRLLVAVGFTGAYTTFSTFEFETNRLLTQDGWLGASLYVAVSVFLGLAALRFGVHLAKT